MRLAATLALSLVGLFAGTTMVSAYPAAADTALNVRSGPGTDNDVVGVLQRGQVVEVIACEGNWCQVEDTSLSGWASNRYLTPVEPAPDTPEPASQPAPEPNVTITIETPDFTFPVGNGERPGYRPVSAGQVCFFAEADYRGRQFCAGSGDLDRYLAPDWQQAIRSVRIEGAAEVTVCSEVDLAGECTALAQSAPSLGDLAGRIASYQVSAF